jgi:hypothetical protein
LKSFGGGFSERKSLPHLGVVTKGNALEPILRGVRFDLDGRHQADATLDAKGVAVLATKAAIAEKHVCLLEDKGSELVFEQMRVLEICRSDADIAGQSCC